MTALEYALKYDLSVLTRVVKRAGTNIPYYRHLCYGNRKPSAALARKLVAASAEETPGSVLDLEGLLFPETRPRPDVKRIPWRKRTIQ